MFSTTLKAESDQVTPPLTTVFETAVAAAVQPDSITPATSTPIPSPPAPTGQHSGGLSGGEIAAIVVPLVSVLFGILYYFLPSFASLRESGAITAFFTPKMSAINELGPSENLEEGTSKTAPSNPLHSQL